jgi:citronellol/citronellal dehydrogenase
VQNSAGGEAGMMGARKPEIMADAAHAILTRPARDCTGNFFIDDEVLQEGQVTDFGGYRFREEASEAELITDLFVEAG